MKVHNFDPDVGLCHCFHLRRCVQIKLFVEGPVGVVANVWVANAGNSAARAEHFHLHSQTAHGLCQFQPQHASTEHRKSLR